MFFSAETNNGNVLTVLVQDTLQLYVKVCVSMKYDAHFPYVQYSRILMQHMLPTVDMNSYGTVCTHVVLILRYM